MHPRDRLGSFGKPAPSSASATAAVVPASIAAEHLAAVRQFVTQLGGVENARNALELLAVLIAAGKTPDPSGG